MTADRPVQACDARRVAGRSGVLLAATLFLAVACGNDTPAVTALDAPAADATASATESPVVGGSPDVAAEAAAPTRVPSRTPTPTHTSTPTPQLASRPTGVPTGAQLAVVARIVDGDTIWVTPTGSGPLATNANHKVRLLEFDSPEATSSTECYGPEATRHVTQLLGGVGAEVWLVADREDTDRYDRYLRYIWTADGAFVNEQMVADGFGEAVLYEPNDRYIDRLRAAEVLARDAGRGMWSACAAPPPPPPPPPAQEPAAPPAGNGGDCDPSYPDVCIPPAPPDLDCGEISHRRFRVLQPDPHGFDGSDGDGVGCESG